MLVCPAAIAPISPADSAVAWNKGITVNPTRGCGAGIGSRFEGTNVVDDDPRYDWVTGRDAAAAKH